MFDMYISFCNTCNTNCTLSDAQMSIGCVPSIPR